MPYLLISTQIRMVRYRCPSLGVGFGPRAGGRCRPHLSASVPGDACGCRDAEAAWDTPPRAAGGWNSDPAWIQGLRSSGCRALPAPGPSSAGKGTTCVPSPPPRNSGACGSGPSCLREVETSERLRESCSLKRSNHCPTQSRSAGQWGWEEWTNLRKRGLKKKRMCYDTETVARLQLRPAPLGIQEELF